MNVVNMFEENAQWRKPLVVPPDPTAPEPYVYEQGKTPYVDEQVNNAFGDVPQFDANAAPVMQVVPQEPTREDRIKARLDENNRLMTNPLFDLIDKGTPPLDEKRQQRLKLAAGFNALGQGISTLYGGYMGAKGGPILAQDNTFTPAALKEYNDRINADNEAKYRNAMAKAAIGREVFGQTARQIEMEDLQKERLLAAKDHQTWTEGENKKTREHQIALVKAKPGEDIDGKLAVIAAREASNMKLIRARRAADAEILLLKSDTNMTDAEKKSKLKMIEARFAAEKEVITTKQQNWETGEETQTQTTRLSDQSQPYAPAATTTTTSTTPDPFAKHGGKVIKKK